MFPNKLMACVAGPDVLEASQVELAWLARKLGCPLVLYHASSRYAPGAEAPAREVETAREIEGKARGAIFEGVEVTVVCDDEPRAFASGVLEAAAHRSVDLVVLPTHPRRGLERLVFKSPAEDLTRGCQVPILTFDLERVPSQDEVAAFDQVIVPTDFSRMSLRAMEVAFRLAERIDCSLTAVHVIQDPAFTIDAEVTADDIRRWMHMDAEEKVSKTIRTVRGERDVPCKAEVGTGSVTNVVKERADRYKNPLVVMATSGRDSLGDFILGSRTERVIRTSRCSVLTLPPVFLRQVAQPPNV